MTFQRDENYELATDPLDQASQREAEFMSIAMEEHKRAMRRQQEPLPDGSYAVTDCDLCGEEIGEARLKVAIKNLWCIHCATKQEKASEARNR